MGEGWDLLNVLRPRVGMPLLGVALSPLLVVGCARRWISHAILEWSALAISASTLFLLGWVQNPWLPPSDLNQPPALLRTLREDSELFRLFSWAPRVSTYNVGAYYKGIVGRPPTREFEQRYLRQFIPPNVGMLYDVATVDGYEALQTRRQALLATYIGSERADYARFASGDGVDAEVYLRSLNDRLNLLAALNVKYLMHAFLIEDPRLKPLDEVALTIYQGLGAVAKVYLYKIETVLPRAFVVPESQVVTDEKAVLNALAAGSVDLRQRVILEQEPPALAGDRLTASGSTVRVVEYGEDRVRLEVHTDGSGFLVLMDFLMPGWTATLDGQPVAVYAANFAGRAVALPVAGDHHVVFSYEAPLLREGLLVSLLSLLLVVLAPLAWKLRRRCPFPDVRPA